MRGSLFICVGLFSYAWVSFLGVLSYVWEDIDFQGSPAVFGICVLSCMLVCFMELFFCA